MSASGPSGPLVYHFPPKMYASPFDCVNAVLEYHPEIVFLIKNTGKIRENFNRTRYFS